MPVHRHPKPSDIEEMIKLKECNIKTAEIARRLGFSARQVREALKRSRRGQVADWSEEETQTLIYYYNLGFNTPAKLAPYLPRKADFSIRNKIQSLKKKNILQTTTESSNVSSPDDMFNLYPDPFNQFSDDDYDNYDNYF